MHFVVHFVMHFEIAGTFYTQKIEVENNRNHNHKYNHDGDDDGETRSVVKFNIWDTAGQERFRSVAPLYYRGAAAAIVVYDVTSYLSLVSAKSWIDELTDRGDPDVLIVLVGNKVDLEPSKNTVTFREADVYAKDNGLLHLGTSAKTAKNVKALFHKIAQELPKPDALFIDEEPENPEEDASVSGTARTPLVVAPGNHKRLSVAQRLISFLVILFCFKRKRRRTTTTTATVTSANNDEEGEE